MIYDKNLQDFLNKILKISSFKEKIDYANQNLERIGSGSGRIVYDIDGTKIFKLAKNNKGIAQNNTEANIGYYKDVDDIVTTMLDSADDDSWLIVEKAKKVNEKRIKELTGIPSLVDLYYYLRNFVSIHNGGRNVFHQNEKIVDELNNNEFANKLTEFISNYSMNTGDLGRPSSYGEVLRDGEPIIVLTDYGLNDEVYNTYYNPKRKQKNYALYELYDFYDGNDDILSDIGNVGNETRKGMWGLIPPSVSDGETQINENFISFIKNRNKYPTRPLPSLPYLADNFHECVNNIKEILNRVDNKKQFYNNLITLQEYLISQNYYDRDELKKEYYDINEDSTSKYSTDNDLGQDGFPNYNQNDTSSNIDNNILTTTDEIVERVLSSMAGSSTVDVKKKCKLAGKGNVSDACNQGDINNLIIKPLKEEYLGNLNTYDFYVNPKLIKNLKPNIRGIITKDGDLYVVNDNWDLVHTQISEILGMYGYEFPKNVYSYLDKYVPVQRYHDTNDFYLSESYSRSKIEKLFDIISNILNKAKEKNPTINFIPKTIDDASSLEENKKTKLLSLQELSLKKQNKYFNGKAYRVDSGFIYPKNTTASDVIRFEKNELGNVNNFAHISDEKLGELDNYPASNIVWITKTFDDAKRYSNKPDFSDIEEYDLNGEIIAEDGDGGYLVLLKNNLNEVKLISLQDLPFKQDVEAIGGEIHSVGGTVRDEFLGKESKDLDILVTGIPFDKLEEILLKYGQVNAVGKSFGILKFKPKGGEEIDIAIPRQEKATSAGGHKGFEVTSKHDLPIEKDLERRDFTINAMAKDINGNIIDPYGGQEDLKNKIIRVVNPEAFGDDPLRMLRAIQFASRFDFTIELNTMQLIQQNAAKIKEISSERILIELDKILKKGNKLIGVQLLKDSGLFKNIFGFDLKQSTIDRSPFEEVRTMGDFIYLLIRLLSNPAEFYKNNLKGDIDTYKEIKALQMGFENGEAINMIEARSVAHNMYLLSPISLQSKILPNIIQNAAQELLQGKYPKTISELAINGNDLMSMGLKGKEIGDTLKNILLKIYSNKVKNNKEELLSLLSSKNNVIKENIDDWYKYRNKLLYYGSPSGMMKVSIKKIEFNKEKNLYKIEMYPNASIRSGEIWITYLTKEELKFFIENGIVNYTELDGAHARLTTIDKYDALQNAKNTVGFRNIIKEEEVNTKNKIEYGALMLFLNIPIWNKITSIIKKEDIYDKPGFGIEKKPHLTILYGFHDNVTADDVFELYKKTTELKPIEIKINGISIFENPEYDVVKFDVKSKILDDLNQTMRQLPNTTDFPKYHAHITISYIKKGVGKKYIKPFEKERIIIGNKLVFSTKEGEKKTLILKEKGFLKENIDGQPDKQKKINVNYVDKSIMKNEFCGNCGWFVNNICNIVMGNVNSNGWCNLWGTKKFCNENKEYNELENGKYQINNEIVDVNFFVKKYDEWNNQGGYPGYKDPSEASVLEFFQNNYEDFSHNEKLKKNLLMMLTDREVLNENKSKSDYTQTKESLLRSKSIDKEMKEEILKYLTGGSTYHEGGKIHGLRIPKIKDKYFNGVSMGADKNGFFVYTHRARSKSHASPDKIPEKEIKFIESTG